MVAVVDRRFPTQEGASADQLDPHGTTLAGNARAGRVPTCRVVRRARGFIGYSEPAYTIMRRTKENLMSKDPHVDHRALADHATNKVNIPRKEAEKRREQVNYLRERLEAHIAAHPHYDLVKLRASGSTAKHTAIRRRRSEGS